MPPKFNISEAAFASHSCDVDADRIRFLRALCKPNTNKCYDGYFAMIVSFLAEGGYSSLTKDIFLKLISATAEQKICSAKMLRASLLHHQKAHRAWLAEGERTWASDADVIVYCRGAQKIAGEGKRARGSITTDLMEDLLTTLASSDLIEEYPDMMDAFLCIHVLGLRFSQFMHLASGDHHSEGDSNYVLLKKDKRVHAADANSNESHLKLLSSSQFEFLLDLIEKRSKPKGTVLFSVSEAPVKLMRAFISSTAVNNGWPSNVEFDGPHCFRHGFTNKLVSEILSERTQQSPAMIKHYARPNRVR